MTRNGRDDDRHSHTRTKFVDNKKFFEGKYGGVGRQDGCGLLQLLLGSQLGGVATGLLPAVGGPKKQGISCIDIRNFGSFLRIWTDSFSIWISDPLNINLRIRRPEARKKKKRVSD